MSDLATLSISGKVATLTLNRPAARNALSVDLLRDLHERLDDLAPAPGVSVLVLAGAAPAFCAGMDLKAVMNEAAAPGVLLHSLADFTLRLRKLPQVTVAKVLGAAIGGGCGLACVCDMAITHADSKMGYPEVDLGVCPAVVAPWVVRKIGPGRARRVLLSGGTMSGREAFDIGMVDSLVETKEQLDGACEALVQRLASGGANALAATKDLLNQLDGSLADGVVKRGADLSAKVISMPETKTMLLAKLGGASKS
ncbi:MAG: enoyl-CoA hydratase/isomerase family protein [Phycisphaerales bacterium]|jgi:enoyl-CoA hydratase/carnithine racemase